MCGIVFVRRLDDKPAHKMVLKRYKAQSSRGKQGYGFITIDKEAKFNEWWQAENETQIEECLRKVTEPTILFHHRFPTSTPNFSEATHPIAVSHKELDYNYYVVHNGIISNDDELKVKHNAEGYEYTTEITKEYMHKGKKLSADTVWNDSESLAIELAKVIDGQKTDIEAKGSIAFIALQVDKKTAKVKKVFYGRNYSNPLKLQTNKAFFSLTSEGEGEQVTPNVLHCYDMESGLFTEKEKKIGVEYVYIDRYAPVEPKKVGFDTVKQDAIHSEYWEGKYQKNTPELPWPKKEEYIKSSELDEWDEYILDLWDQQEDIKEKMKVAMLEGDEDTLSLLKDENREIETELRRVENITAETVSAEEIKQYSHA